MINHFQHCRILKKYWSEYNLNQSGDFCIGPFKCYFTNLWFCCCIWWIRKSREISCGMIQSKFSFHALGVPENQMVFNFIRVSIFIDLGKRSCCCLMKTRRPIIWFIWRHLGVSMRSWNFGMPLPSANEVWDKVIFYSCLSFCSQEVSVWCHFLSGCLVPYIFRGFLCVFSCSFQGVSVQSGSLRSGGEGVSLKERQSLWRGWSLCEGEGGFYEGVYVKGFRWKRGLCEKVVCVKKSLSVKEDADPLALTSSGGHQSRWYTFHWNAFLFFKLCFGLHAAR